MASLIRIESVYDRDSETIVEINSGLISIGRDSTNTIIVDSTAVSRNHGALMPAGTHWVYRDLGSTNGSFVNDIPVTSGDIKLIKSGDLIRVANFILRVIYLDQARPLESSLLIFSKGEFEREYFVSPLENFEAGGDSASITIDGENNSRILFCVYQNNNGLYLQVNEMNTPLIINGTVGRGLVTLANGDQISVGLYNIIVNFPVSLLSETVEGGAIDLASAEDSFAQSASELPEIEGFNSYGMAPEPTAADDLDYELPERSVKAYSRQTLHDRETPEMELPTTPTEASWTDESARRKTLVGRTFVFGKEQEEDDSGTLSMHSDEFHRLAGLSMSVTQRMAAISGSKDKNVKGEQIFVFLGVVVLTVLIAIAINLFL